MDFPVCNNRRVKLWLMVTSSVDKILEVDSDRFVICSVSAWKSCSLT